MNRKRYTQSQLDARGYSQVVNTHIYGIFAKRRLRILMDKDKEGFYTYNSRSKGHYIEPTRQKYSFLEKLEHWVDTGRWIR